MSLPRVLYVEDSIVAQKYMHRYLDADCKIEVAASARQALASMMFNRYDLFIFDFVFPDGDATGLIQRVRNTPNTKGVPIIVVSGTMDDTMLGTVLKLGANDGFAKPLDAAKFRETVLRMIREPYVRELSAKNVPVICVQWAERGEYFEYCPELGIKCSGENAAVANQRMSDALSARLTAGSAMGFIYEEKLVTHYVRAAVNVQLAGAAATPPPGPPKTDPTPAAVGS